MSLSWRERGALRAIERALTEEDPSLAAHLHGPAAAAAPATVLAGFAWSFLGVSLALLVSGMALDDAGWLTGGALVLGVFPPLILFLAVVLRLEQ